MEDVESKSQMPQEDIQITHIFSRRLAESIEGFQDNINEILDAIEQDESFSEMTAENYDQKKSYLIKHLSELSFVHKVLADQHVHLIGEVKKQNLDSSKSSSPQVTEELGFQQNVNEILEAIEQDESFSEMTAENYDQKKSYLVEHLTELSSMHKVLADQHVYLIGEVKKQNLDSSDSSSPQVTEKGFQQIVNDVLGAIEQDESFSEMTDENYDQKKSYLIERLTELSCMHKVLTDQHVHLVGIVKKQNLDSSDLSSPQVTEELGFQQNVNEILEAIEQDESFSEMTAENYDQKKSYLIKHLTQLSRIHRVLADQYVHLIGEVGKQNLDSFESSSQVTQMLTPGLRSKTFILRTPIGFDFVLSPSWRGINIYKTEDSESSFPLSPDSDSETFLSTIKLLMPHVDDDSLKVKETKAPEFLSKKNSDAEAELVSFFKKLLEYESSKLMHEIQETESEIKTQKANLEDEKAKVIETLELVISDSNLKIKTMGDELETAKKKLSVARDIISNLNSERHSNSKEIQRLKDQLTSDKQFLASVRKEVDSHAENILGLQEQVSLHEAQLSKRDHQIKELKMKNEKYISKISLLENTHNSKEKTWNAEIVRLKGEVKTKSTSFDDLKNKYNNLIVGRARLCAQRDTLRAEKCSLDNLIRELETRLNSLQVEHEEVLLWFHDTQEVKSELILRVEELEREVDRQKEVISDRTEEKMEAIRQLSSSLEHYMSRYKELHKAFVAKRACCLSFLR